MPRKLPRFFDGDREIGDGGFGLNPGDLPGRSPGEDPIDRTDPPGGKGELTRRALPRSTERPSERAALPRRPGAVAPEVAGGTPTPSQSTSPEPTAAAGGQPNVFTPLPAVSPQTLAGTGGGPVSGPTAATPGDGGDGISSLSRGLDPRTFGTISGSPVLGAGGGLLGGGLTTPTTNGGEAEIDDLLAAILALQEGGGLF